MLIGPLQSFGDTLSGKDLIQIGRDEGTLVGKLEGLLMPLESRFGSIEPALRQRISKLDSIDQNKPLVAASSNDPITVRLGLLIGLGMP